MLVKETLYRGFNNRHHLAAFAGLAPSPYTSGGMRQEQGIKGQQFDVANDNSRAGMALAALPTDERFDPVVP